MIKKKTTLFVLAATACITAMFLASSCRNSADTDPSRYLPSVSGNAGDVLIVINRNFWEGEVGDALRDILACDYPFLPQREPVFTLYNTPHSSFSGSFMVHRNIIIANISPEIDSAGMEYHSNVWAKPQVVVGINARDEKEAVAMIGENREMIVNTIEQGERDRIINNSIKFEDRSVRETVTGIIGGSPYFPRGYTIKKKTGECIWISQETTYVNQGILVFKFPYTDPAQLSREYMEKKLYSLWQKHVPGMRENSYMTPNRLIQPSFENISYRGMPMIEMRGLWEVENDYMGGPFVCHIFPDRQNRNIIILNGFVYAPKYDKRNYLRQVESILYSFRWK